LGQRFLQGRAAQLILNAGLNLEGALHGKKLANKFVCATL